MKDIQVKEIMIPISNYVTVKKESSLIEVILALEAAKKSEKEHAHRDAIVVDNAGDFIGNITMMDIFRALEPNYKKVPAEQTKGVLSKKFVMDAVKDFNLWMEPMETVFERGKNWALSM